MPFSDASTRSIAVAGHICLDLIPAFPTGGSNAQEILRPGALRHVGPVALSPGGVVSNTGLALHRLGVPVQLIGRVGHDLFGQALLSQFADNGAPIESMIRIVGETTSYSIVIDAPGVDRAFLHCPGANDRFDPASLIPSDLVDCRILHFGYPQAMRGTYADGGEALAIMFKTARDAGIVTSLDTCFPDPNADSGKVDWPMLLQRVLPSVDLFCPSWDELWMMLERRPIDAAKTATSPFAVKWLRTISERLLNWGAAIVLMKLGPDGLFVSTTCDDTALSRLSTKLGVQPSEWRGRSLYAPCFQVHAASTTGAGDMTVAGFLAALRDGHGPATALRFATAVGAHRVESRLGVKGIPPAEAVSRRIDEGWLQNVPCAEFSDWRRSDADQVWEDRS